MTASRPTRTRTLVLSPAIALSVLLASAQARSHGVEPTGTPATPAQTTTSIWSFLANPAEAAMHMRISRDEGYRYIKSDGIADHPTGRFPNSGNPHSIKSQDYNFRVALNPKASGRITRLGHQNFGVALSGVPFDPLTAEYWNRDRSSGWNVEALSGAMNLGLDENMAHVQPTGAYHYHGLPKTLVQRASAGGPALLGYAADGFPIYGPYGFGPAELKASHRIKSGTRPSGPGGRYDGTYVQDYEYVAGLGDLDSCNGMTAKTREYPNGTYLYVITNNFPFIPRCWAGSPDASFTQRMGGAPGGMMGGPGGMMDGGPGGGMRRPPPRGGMMPPPGERPW